MSNFELFDDDFWTTRSSGNIAGTPPSGGGSSGQGDPPPRCEGCDETSPYGENSCSSEQSCGCPVDGANPRSASGIHYSSGSTQKTCTDASVSGGAVPWSFKRTQDSHDQYYLSRSAGTGWKTSQTAQIGQYPNFYRVEFSEKDAVNFSLTPAPDGTYKALDNYPETLTIDLVTSAYTIVRKNGTVWNFSGSTVAILQHVQNEEGRQTLFSYDSAGRLWKVQQLSETEQVVSEMEYTYDTASQESIVEIVVRKGKSGILHNQTRIAYTYYQEGESFGNAGDLKTVRNAVWSEAAQAWQDTSAEYYRYYTQSGTFGKKHQLRMEFNAVDFAFLREKFGEQWQTISDDTALDYCTQYFEYDDRNRISLTRKNRNRLVFRYAYENCTETNDYNAIICKTTECGPHGEQTLVFTNFRDKVLLKKITPPDTSDAPPAIYYFRYDSRGNVTHSYNPKCVLDYSIETGQSATLNVSLSPDEGRIEITEYGNGTTTPADQPLARYLQNGTSGNRIVLQRYEYAKRQVDSRIRWYVSSSTHYTDEAGTNSATTSYAYTFFPNSLQISRRTTTLPDSANREECFDISGRITWQKDELGIITYHGYDVVSGLEIRTIQDVDTAKTSDFTTPVPSGWSTVPEAGKHLIYETEYDAQGRVTQTLGPANESVNTENRNILTRSARWTIYDDVNFRITSANGFVQIGENLAEHIVNPVIVTISDANGRLLESITARRISTSGRLTAADVFLQTDYLSWSVNIYAGDQLVEKRDYFTIPTNGPGEESAHYNATRYHYDAYGRRDLIISPDGTVTKTVFDWQDNPTQTWLGTSPADLTLVAETLYGGEDGGCPTCSGTTAKPRLTIQHVDADTMRITEYGYDWRGRRIHVHNEEDENGLSIYNLTTYDNLDRTIKTERYLSLDPVPDRLLARTETFYDMRGNVWKTEQSIVNPADGTVQGKLLARSWFDAAGRTIRTQALGENRATVTAYDSLGRVVSAATQLWTMWNSELVHLEYTYDRLGNRTSKRDVLAEQAGADLDEIYTNDQQNQQIDLDRVGNHEHFHYDTTGNWLAYQQNGTLQTRTHNAANEIVSVDGSDTSLRTDAAGNMTRIPNPKAVPGPTVAQNLNLTYDAWNRLVRVSTPDGSEVISCSYDGLNRRVRKTTASETREYYYNKNWQCLEEYLYGTLQNSYLWGLRYLDDLICFTPDYTIALTDANFNVVAVANQSGLTERYTYTAFGQRTILTPSYAPRSESVYPALTRTFTSQVLDHETGVMLYRNRYYHSDMGRFVTRDPIGYREKGYNLYRYGKNCPIIHIDSYGLQSTSSCQNDFTDDQVCEIVYQNQNKIRENGKTIWGCVAKYKGRLIPCSFFELRGANAWDEKGVQIAHKCTLEHEQIHLNDVKNGAKDVQFVSINHQISVLGFVKGAPEYARSECRAYRKSLNCITQKMYQCEGDYACEMTVEFFKDMAVKGILDNCK